MHRFFIERKKISYNEVIIEGDDANHIYKVLRLRAGDFIELCDMEGTDYIAQIARADRDAVRVFIKDTRPSQGEPHVRITLYQGIPKSSKMDFIIQKCVEAGVHEIVPVITSRTVVKLKRAGKVENRIARWRKIAKESAKQSRRGIIPAICEPRAFEDAVIRACHTLKIIFWEEEREKDLKAILSGSNATDIAVFVGPEGGFDEAEISCARQHGWNLATLGPRILRTETTGIVAISAIMFHMGEMRWR